MAIRIRGGGASANIYTRPTPLDYYTSYFTYDAAWNSANGVYNYGNTSGTQYTLSDIWNLNQSNAFGNNKRFTSDAGGYWDESANTYHLFDGTLSNYATVFGTTNYMIDHFTGLGWCLTVGAGFGISIFSTGLSNINGLTFNGFSDWRACSLAEILTIQTYAGNGQRVAVARTPTVSAPLFSAAISTIFLADSWSASFALALQSTEIRTRGVTSAAYFIAVRTHY